MVNLISTASGLVLPPGTQEKLAKPETDLTVTILQIDPENGYAEETGEPIPSENEMAKVQYPDGTIKNHQVKDIVELLERVKNQILSKYEISSFDFGDVPNLEAGAVIQIKGVK